MLKNRMCCLLITMFSIGVLAACVAPNAPVPSPTPLPASTSAPTVAPIATPTVVPPAAPTSAPTAAPIATSAQASASPRDPGVSGVARWGTTLVPDAIVELRTSDWRVNPDAVLQSAITDPEGRYFMPNAPAGDYVMCGLFPEGVQERSTCTPVHIEAGQDTPEINVMLLRTVQTIGPAADKQVSATPSLSWNRFLGATSYELFVIDAGTTELVVHEFVTDNLFTIQTPLQVGRTYDWVVNAVAADGGLLADIDSRFVVQP